MSGIRVEVNVNDRELQRSMSELMARGRDLAAPLRSIGEMMLRSTEMRFRAQQDPEGQAWTPLKPSTRAQKRHAKILTESTALRGSIAYRVGSDRLQVGTPSVYGAIHQLGGDIRQPARTQVIAFHGKKGKAEKFMRRKQAAKAKKAISIRFASISARTIQMPARPYLGISSQDRERIVKILTRHLAGKGP